jgi:hypothetical protein
MKALNEKTNILQDNRLARLSGILYLLLIPLGILGIIYVPTVLIDPENISTTVSNIIKNEPLFRWSIVSALVVQFVNIILVVMLFKLFNRVNKTMASLMAFLNEINNLAILSMLDQKMESEQLISVFLNLHQQGIIMAQVFWGLWLFPLGYLVYHSGYMPKLIGILLMIGCVGYVVDSFTLILLPKSNFTLSGFTFIGEVIFPLWLLIKGIKQTEQITK